MIGPLANDKIDLLGPVHALGNPWDAVTLLQGIKDKVGSNVQIFYNHLNTGRPFKAGDKFTSRYIDVLNTPLYPFGYGLSYTTFSYSPLRLNTQTLGWNNTLQVSVKVTNTGTRKGTDVVQLYIHELVRSISPPVRELKGFQRVTLEAGASKRITFQLTKHDLSFYKNDMSFGAEPGKFEVFVGGNPDSLREATFTLNK